MISIKVTHRHLSRSYYADNGLDYNIGRVNMGGCDFSTRPYSYDDIEEDSKLEHFALTVEDTLYKVRLSTVLYTSM